MTDRWVKRWQVESASKPGTYHVVAQDAAGNWGCDCWPWKRTRQTCRHIEQVKQGLVIEEKDDA